MDTAWRAGCTIVLTCVVALVGSGCSNSTADNGQGSAAALICRQRQRALAVDEHQATRTRGDFANPRSARSREVLADPTFRSNLLDTADLGIQLVDRNAGCFTSADKADAVAYKSYVVALLALNVESSPRATK